MNAFNRYQVNYEKEFTAGVLKGKYYACNYIRFPDLQSAQAFAALCDGKTQVLADDGTDWAAIMSCPILTELEN